MVSFRRLASHRYQPRSGLALLLFVLGTTCIAGCDQAQPLPTVPSPLPTDKVGVLGITCPAAIIRQSMSLADPPIPITFPPSLVVGGQAPVTSSCTHESGSPFSIGTTQVACDAADSLGQEAACSFAIMVRPAPRIQATRFLAFGDSITAGVVSDPFVFGTLNPSEAYSIKLEAKMSRDFPLQSFTVENAGLSGETAASAPSRFSTAFGQANPDVVLLLEGSNDVLGGASGVPDAIDGLETMIMTAKAGGAEVLLATIPPMRDAPSRARAVQTIPLLNDGIRALAFRQDVGLVDVFTALNDAVCPQSLSIGVTSFHVTVPCIGEDHLHPTVAGYDVLAETFKQAIVEAFGVNIESSRMTMRLGGTVPRSADVIARSRSSALRPQHEWKPDLPDSGGGPLSRQRVPN